MYRVLYPMRSVANVSDPLLIGLDKSLIVCDAWPVRRHGLPSQPIGHRCSTTGTKLYCLVKKGTCVCEQLAQYRYLAAERPGVKLATS